MFFLIFSPDTSTLSPESWALSHRTCNQSDRGEIEQLNVHKEYLIMLLEMSKTSGKTFAPCANVAAIVKLAKVVEDLVRKSKSQIWF